MIVADKLEKKFGNIQALRDVSFEIKDGELYGFIGPDGAGKTTLFRIITSLMIQDSGKATVFGFDNVKDFRKIRNITGYMPGRFSLYQDLSVEENLGFFASVFGTTIEENYEIIKEVYIQIEPFKKRLAGQLSGGMKQKLALCCSLIHYPKLLVLDEPTTGVDAVSRKEFWDLLKGLIAKGITVLVSTPYMDEANLCDKVSLIQNGTILKTDHPGAIAKGFGKKLFDISSDNIYQLIQDLKANRNVDSVFPFGQSVHYTDKTEDVSEQKLKKFLNGKNHQDVRVKEIEPGIEDVFMKLMQMKEE